MPRTPSSWMGGCLQEDAAPSCGGSCGHEDTALCVRAAGHNGQQKFKGRPRGAAVQTQVEIPERMCKGLNERQTGVAPGSRGRAAPRAATCCSYSAVPWGSCSEDACACSSTFPCLRATSSRSAREKEWSMCTQCANGHCGHRMYQPQLPVLMSCCWHHLVSAVQLCQTWPQPGKGTQVSQELGADQAASFEVCKDVHLPSWRKTAPCTGRSFYL